MLEFNQFNLSLVRHSQSETNATPDMMGQIPNSKITNLGRRQAQLLGLRFEKQFEIFDRIYCSEYPRAIETAKIALPYHHDSIITTPDLREYSAGDWTEAKRSEVITPGIKLKMNYMGSGFLPPNGESMHQVERRASQWLENTIVYNPDICQLAKYRQQQGLNKLNLIAFSHGMTIKCLLHYIMDFSPNFIWKIELKNTSITKLSFDEEGWKLLCINDYSHLM